MIKTYSKGIYIFLQKISISKVSYNSTKLLSSATVFSIDNNISEGSCDTKENSALSLQK